MTCINNWEKSASVDEDCTDVGDSPIQTVAKEDKNKWQAKTRIPAYMLLF